MKKLFLLSALFLNSAFAETLSFKEAKKILDDSFSVSFFSDTDYSKPENIIKATLAGLYDAHSYYEYVLQDERKQQGKTPLPADYPLITVGGKSIPASSVLSKEYGKADPKFQNLPKTKFADGFNVRLDKEAVDLAAPYFTGYKIVKHYQPEADGFFFAEDIYFDGKAYYLVVDGLGDNGMSWKLENVKPEGNGYLLTGTLNNEFEETKSKFSLKIAPSETVKGTWKRVKFDY